MLRFLRFLILIIPFNVILAQPQTVGVFQNDAASFNGYTLISPTGSNSDYLIDNCGNVIKSWTSNYPHGEVAYFLENGHLLRTARVANNFQSGGSGGRIELYDWDGALVWSYNYSTNEYQQHHDVEMLPNGNILLIAWETKSSSEAVAAGRNPSLIGNNGVWPEHIIELEPIGSDDANIVWEWHLWDHLIQDFDATKANYGVVADHPELIDINFAASVGGITGGADWIHANAIAYNAELDQIILNSRVFSEFWIIDHSTTTAEAATSSGGNSGKGGDILYRWGNPQAYDRGLAQDQKMYGQHDAHWIPEGYTDAGKIIVYNNGQDRPGDPYSSVDIINPPVDSEGNYPIQSDQAFSPSQLSWTYDGLPENEFFSGNLSGANRLSNGNTLICVGRIGHIFEIDPAGNIVWDYINPVTPFGPVSQGDFISNNSVFRAYRYGVDYPGFDGKNIIAGEPLELDPFPSNCEIIEEPVSVSKPPMLENVRLLENPIRDLLTIENETGKIIQIEIVDLTGRVLLFKKSTTSIIQIEANQWTSGMYILRISDPASKLFFVQKLIKQ